MKEFIDKLIERLEEAKQKGKPSVNGKTTMRDIAVYKMTMGYAIEMVTELAEEYKGGWIACSDRLPEVNGWYLVTNSLGVVQQQHWGASHWEKLRDEAVIAWMPLPAPYTEGEAELYRAKSVDGEYQEYKGDWK